MESVSASLGRPVGHADTATLLYLVNTVGLPMEVILLGVGYAVSVNKANLRYAEKVLLSWADEGLVTVELAENHLKTLEERRKTGEKLPDGSPIRPGDIAVLLRTRAECIQMQTILENFNIPAVCLKNGNIYNDIEAYALYQVLCGALEPANHQKVSTALAGFLCNIPLAELDTAVAANEINFAIHREKFHKMNQLWYQKGFSVMFEYFLGAFNVRENLASRRDGERRLTNL